MELNITVLAGDGIGPEVTAQGIRLLKAVAERHGHTFVFNEKKIGGAAIRETGIPLPEDTITACLAGDAVFLGAVGSPEFDALPPERRPESGLLALRKALGGFANLRPAIAYPSIAESSPLKAEVLGEADILIVRELLGGLYFGQPRGIEEVDGKQSGFNTMRYSEDEIERVARVAFEAARNRRKFLASVDKANVLETSRLWRQVVGKVSADYPDVKVEHHYVDSFAMHLVMNPQRFDVVVSENLFGDILSDEAAVITGSLGLLGSATIGGKIDLYEPVHGSAPDIAGTGKANPIGAIASAAMLLRHSAKLEVEATAIENAIKAVLDAGYRTEDIARGAYLKKCSTEEMGSLILEHFLASPSLSAAQSA